MPFAMSTSLHKLAHLPKDRQVQVYSSMEYIYMTVTHLYKAKEYS